MMSPHDLTTRHRRLATLLVGLLAMAAFLPSLRNGFVYDDEKYILQNPLIASWSWEHLRAILTQPYFGNFHPLHLLLILAEHALFGLHPAPWHAVSLVLHAANAMLLAAFLPRVGVSRPIALAGAAIFAVHPVQAESVAWISEQKSLLSLLFMLLSLGAYLDARASGSRGRLAASIVGFLAALVAKVEGVALVPVLIGIEWLKPPCLGPGRGRPLLRLIPFVLLAGAWANFEILAHGRSGFIHPYPGGSLLAALLSIGPVLALYAKNLLWPTGLSAAYDLAPSTEMSPVVTVALWSLVLGGVGSLSSMARREPERRIALGIVWIGATLAPVLNLVPIGTLLNDRYLYLPLCAIGPMLVSGIVTAERVIFRRATWMVPAPVGALLAGLILAGLAGASAARSSVWHDEERLWTDATAKSPGSAHARYNLGTLWLERGQMDIAEREFRAALAADPALVRPWQSLAVIHYRRGRYRMAAAEFAAAARLEPRNFDNWMNLASAQARVGKDEEAIAALRQAVTLRPRTGRPRMGLGLLLEKRGDDVEAARAFREALDAGDLPPSQTQIAEEHLRHLGLRNSNSGHFG